jgi:ATP/maltotriose-dependent transcriptional regulator MalT
MRGAYGEIPELLARIPSSSRLGDPRAMALRALKNVSEGDVPSAIALFRRAIEHSDARTAHHLLDLYVPLLITRAEFESAEAALDFSEDLTPELAPALIAMRAQIAASRGRDAESRECAREAVERVRGFENGIFAARVLQRTALAAYYREDFDEAQERGLEAARLFESVDSYRNAAMAYSLLYVIAHDWLGTPDVARFYAQRMAMRARLGGDVSLENYGVVAQLEIATETGDVKRVGSLRARLFANPLHEQYREKFAFVVADTLASGWAGRFDVARATLSAGRRAENRSLPERALCDALLAVVALAEWDVAEARRFARLAIGETANRGEHEALFDARRRGIARLIAAGVCVAIGDPSRARRALSRPFDPEQRFTEMVTADGLPETEVPPLMRGYARFLNTACEAGRRRRPQLGLTPAEMAVLRALPGGHTIAALAQVFGKSPKTIETQVSAIYAKLNVSNRAQAIQRARELGLQA